MRTLLLGILLALSNSRPAHLSRVHAELLGLKEADRVRLGVDSDGHLLTYRQVEYTFSIVVRALSKQQPDGAPSSILSAVADAVVEASIPEDLKATSSSYAIDWSDHESFCRPPTGERMPRDKEASWGHRQGGPTKGELFFGYYFQLATMVREEAGEEVAELARRMHLGTCRLDPVPAFVPVLSAMAAGGVLIGDVLVDSGYAHRNPEKWALPVRRLGGRLVMDLHPHDRGTRGTYAGAVCHNGNLYCPATPKALFSVEPLALGADRETIAVHDKATDELSRYKLGRISKEDADGYHRVSCPAELDKVRCSMKPDSTSLPFDRPEVVSPPKDRPRCCSQKTVTVPPEVNAKTRQKHDYPSQAHRKSYARRTAVERSYSSLKDPASTDTTRGWCRVMGLCAVTLMLVCGVVVRNVRVHDAFVDRQHEQVRRQELGLQPKTRRRRRQSIADIVQASI